MVGILFTFSIVFISMMNHRVSERENKADYEHLEKYQKELIGETQQSLKDILSSSGFL